MALVAFLFSMNVNAQNQEPKQKKKVKTEKSCSAEEKKSCDKDGKGEVSDCSDTFFFCVTIVTDKRKWQT